MPDAGVNSGVAVMACTTHVRVVGDDWPPDSWNATQEMVWVPTGAGTVIRPPPPALPTLPTIGDDAVTPLPSVVHRTVEPTVTDDTATTPEWPTGRVLPAGVMVGAMASAVAQWSPPRLAGQSHTPASHWPTLEHAWALPVAHSWHVAPAKPPSQAQLCVPAALSTAHSPASPHDASRSHTTVTDEPWDTDRRAGAAPPGMWGNATAPPAPPTGTVRHDSVARTAMEEPTMSPASARNCARTVALRPAAKRA